MKRLIPLPLLVLCAQAFATTVLGPTHITINAAPIDTLTVTDTSGSIQTNRPVSVGRPFVQGEIPNFAQASVNGSPVTTQVDVKNRWPDGSLKFAIVSFIIPSLAANGSVTVSFTNQATGNNTSFLTQSQMLATGYNFDGQIQVANGAVSHNISARAILNAAGTCSDPGSDPDGSTALCKYWLKGPIVTAVILEDRSGRSFDVNTDAATGNPLHPIFEAWFYPQGNLVMLGYSLENDWASTTATSSARDQTYSLVLTGGNTSPATELSLGSATQRTRTRVHRSYCINGPGAGTAYACGPALSIDYNWAYLASTGFTPNWDPSLVLSPSLISGQVSSFASMPQGFEAASTGGQDGTGGIGFYTADFDGTGTNPSHGPLTTWDIITLQSEAPSMFAVTYGNADLGNIIPYFYREADTNAGHGQTFDNSGIAGNVQTQGRVVSINARTQVSLLDVTAQSCNTNYAADWIAFGGGGQDVTPWGTANLDTSHWPNLAFTSYLLAGQYAYYEEQMMQTAYALGGSLGSSGCAVGTGRLRAGAAGYWDISQERATDWTARENMLGAFIAVDGSPEKAYFTDKLKANIAVWEGEHSIPNDVGAAYSAAWTYGNVARAVTNYTQAGGGPLGSWTGGLNDYATNNPLCNSTSGTTNGGLNAACPSGGVSYSAENGNSYFQNGYSGIAVTWLNDLGFCTGDCAFLDYITNFYSNEALNPSASIYDFVNYVYPTADNTGVTANLTTWPQFESLMIPNGQTGGKANSFTGYCTGSNYDEWYPGIIGAVMAELTSRTSSSGGYSGLTAYNTFRSGAIAPCLAGLASVSPKWDVVPRTLSSANLLSPAAGWHKIPATALCGNGPENTTGYLDPDNFPQNLNASYPSYGAGFSDQINCQSLMEDSSSGVYDTKRHRLVLYGGGHEHYEGNDVTSLEMTFVNSTTAMVHLDHSAQPGTCPSTGTANTTVTESNGAICHFNSSGAADYYGNPGCSYTAGCTPTQSPTAASVHTYNGVVYVPGYDELALFGGVTNPLGDGTPYIWTLAMGSVVPSCAPNTTTNQQGCNPNWNLANTNFSNADNAGQIAIYDPNTQGVFVRTPTDFQWFNPANNTVTEVSQIVLGYHSSGVIDPIDKYFITIGPSGTGFDGIQYVNIACSGPPSTPSNCPGVGTSVKPTTTGCAGLLAGPEQGQAQYMGAQWDPVSNQVVIYPNGTNVIYLLNTKTWTCTTETYGSTQGTDYPQPTVFSAGTSGDEGTFGHFQYDPTFDIYVLCNDPNNDCWYLRRAR